jgi:hypothetical protein
MKSKRLLPLRLTRFNATLTASLRLAFLAVTAFLPLACHAALAAEETEKSNLTVRKLADGAAWEIVDGELPVLRYNYQIVREPDEVKDKISADNQKYAVARADYVHPLYGPHGEVLTDDWVPDHPHHRGIYWAWPEVDWKGNRGDLHALQQVFARPTGKIESRQGDEFAEIFAENEWRWDDRTAIVREQVLIRAGRKTTAGRAIDLTFRFTAIGADVQVARRATKLYGGLNVRLSPAQDQQITTFTDSPGATPRRAWADRTGVPRGGNDVVGLAILQSPRNPDYPGDWVQYPEISWIQPTFPAADTRYTITKDRPLELHYRLWIHEGKIEPEKLNELWSVYEAE